MRTNLENIKKITELLRKLQPHMSEEELEKQSQNLYELAIFLVRLKAKAHSKASKTHSADVLEEDIRRKPIDNKLTINQ